MMRLKIVVAIFLAVSGLVSGFQRINGKYAIIGAHSKVISRKSLRFCVPATSSQNESALITSVDSPAPDVATKPPASTSLKSSGLDVSSPFGLIGEQFKELKSGLEEFQAETYEQLYGKDVKWRLEEKDLDDILIPSKPAPPVITKKVPEPITPATAPEVAVVTPKPSTPMPVNDVKVVPKIPPVPIKESFVKPSAGFTTSAGTVAKPEDKERVVEGIILMDVPIGDVQPDVKEDEKVAVLRAQQAISKSFLSAGRVLSEMDINKIKTVQSIKEDPVVPVEKPVPPKQAPAASSSNIFSFFSPKPSPPVASKPVQPAQVKPVEAAPVAAKAQPKPKAEPAPVAVPAAKKAESVPASQPFGGLLNFLQSDPNVNAIAAAKAKPVPAAAASAAKPAPTAPKPAPATPTAPASTNLFGFMNSKPAEPAPVKVEPAVAKKVEAVKPAPAKVAPTTPAKSAPAATPSGGFFGFMGSSPKPEVVQKKEEATAPAMATKKVEAAASKTPVVPAPKPATPAAPASSNFFGFMNSKPAEPAPVKVEPAVAKKVEAVKPAPAKVTPTTPAKPAPAPASSGGFFGFMGSSPKPETAPKKEEASAPAMATKKVEPAAEVPLVRPYSPWGATVPAPKEPKARPVSIIPADGPSMNAKYQLAASALLKKDPVKLRAFQKATDQYRSADLTAQQFLSSLEQLFGKDDLESVVAPLVDALPEKESGRALKAAFDKKFAPAAPTSGGMFGGFFGGSKPTAVAPAVTPAPVKPVPAPVPAPPAPAKSSSMFGGMFGAAKPAPTTAAVATGVKITVPAKVPANKKSFVEDQIKGLVTGSIDPKSFYTTLSKSLGKATTKEILPGIVAQVSKEIGAKLNGISLADK